MFTVQVLPWSEAEPLGASNVRRTVFIEEQGIDESLEWDIEGDPKCEHAVALHTVSGEPAGTGRLLDDGHIGRMAVKKQFRGQGVGRLVLEALEHRARLRGMQTIQLNAQISASGFYRALGYEQEGACFMEAGIEHVAMKKKLV